jgi:eukaryotic-like serine/threonine-protein kinase
MYPNDPTHSHELRDPGDSSEAEWNAGMAAAFGHGETCSYHPAADPEAGTILAGKYRLSERIGEGGMGSVWVAHQSEPVKRKVAVKLIKAGMDSKSVLARFEAERQALAVMDHPTIAKVLDGGLHDGRPFFVMELVKGVPITEYCDACKLKPKERLELFVPVCQAIQHAHQKGIIHRDIKPSNVLIALYDDKPVPKVIDFGIAKATGGTLTEHTIETAFGGVVGTPQYMSPEQASLNNLDIDTRSDVYSLGVLLYELLTGSPPFARKELEKKGLLEILRVVREEEPPRPSTKLSTAAALPSLSASRGTEPKKLTGLLRNELDWIVMKALEKDRARRYETANGFAADVQRYLSGEAVVAHPPSTAYRLKKFVRRNKGQVIAASLVLFALVAGIAGTTLGFLEARRQTVFAREKEAEAVTQAGIAQANESLANTRLQEVEAEKRKVEAEKKRADEEKKIAQAVSDFLQNKLLAQADTTAQANALLKAGGLASEAKLNPTVRELLDRTAKELAHDKIEANLPKQPLVQAHILQTVGEAYRGIGEAATGLPFLERSVELFKATLGPDHHDTLISMSNLIVGYHTAGKLDKALPLCEETLARMKAKLGPDHNDTLTGMNNLAAGYHAAGKLDLALPLYEETLKIQKTKLGPDHPHTLRSMGNLAEAYRAAGKLDKALPLYEETFTLSKAKLGPDHPHTLATMNSLAVGYREAGKLDKALSLYEETLTLQKAKLGRHHPDTLRTMHNHAEGYRVAGKLDKALSLYEETLALQKAKLGPDHSDTLSSMSHLAACYWSMKQLDKSVPLFEEVLPLREKKLGRGHPDTQMTVANLGVNYRDTGRLKEAIPLLEEAYQSSKKIPGLRFVLPQLIAAYVKAGQPAGVAKLIDERLPEIRKTLPKDGPELASQLVPFGKTLLDAKGYAEAEPLFREGLAIREKVQPDSWQTFFTQSLLGGALLGQKKYADAEPLLVKGYEGMKAREKTIPRGGELRIPEALDRLIELYTALGKADEAKKYRELRAKYPTPKESAPMLKEKK